MANTASPPPDVPDSATEEYRDRLEMVLGIPFVDGNDVRLLNNGDQIFPAMLEAIAQARRSIDFETYVYWRGDIADRFADALCRAGERGCRVRVLLDSYGAKKIDTDLVDRFGRHDVELRWFRPLSSWRVWRTDKRTHRKLLICDDQVGFTGGVGIAGEWEGDARNEDEWRDVHARIDGPAVGGLRAAFADNWNEAGPWQWEPHLERPQQRFDGVPIQVVRASATVGWTDIATLMRSLVNLARRQLRIETAYFVPDTQLLELLESAVGRGVRVEILIPGQHTDSRWSQLAGLATTERLVAAGASIGVYNRTMMHSKFLTVDGVLACIGSANLNHRSLGKDEECCAVISSRRVTSELDRTFAADRAHSRLLTEDELAQRGPIIRAGEWLARRFIEEL